MRTMLALATVGLLAAGGSALAQEIGAPGAVGVAPGMSGSNPPFGGMRSYDYDPGYYGPGYGPGYYDGGGFVYGLREGRTAAEDAANPTPGTVRGGRFGHGYGYGW